MTSIGLTDAHIELADVVARWAATEVGDDGRRVPSAAHWAQMVKLGWPMLHVSEAHGGQGFGLPELVVVLEELGRAGVGGPLVPTALAAAVLDEVGEAGAPFLKRLAAGESATVAFASEPVDVVDASIDARFGGVLGADDAAFVIVPTTNGWLIIDGDAVDVEETVGVDLSRPVSTIRCRGAGVELGVDDARVRDLATLLLAAEAVGVGAWCVSTASDYARQRVQFGRPIGQFQAVKHRCADMLADLEIARAATWDAARGGGGDEERLAIACVGASVPDLVTGIAKDCIQVLGGIGFTFEHDAHRFLRRALATQSLLPPSHQARSTIVRLVQDGVDRGLPLELPESAEAFRPAVRSFLDELRSEPKASWNQIVADRGYLVPHWPAPWGLGADAGHQVVIDQEFREARIRRPHLQVAAWALPTLLAHGSAEQLDRWMGPSLRQEIMWCQLFSEPEAGSDLASLRMRAVRDGDGWRLTGQKVWTSMAHTADWGICLARTSPDKPKHEGITCFFVDMSTPGIEVRPLREINGDAWFNEVFFDDVFVPDDCVVGAVDDGWRAGRTTLANERVSMGSGSSIGAGVSALVGLLDSTSSPHDVAAVGERLARDAALNALRNRMLLRSLAGADAGPEASVVKLVGVIHDQDVQEVGMRLFGPAAAALSDGSAGWVSSFLWNRSLTIAGGTSEVQRNVIAERLLGLPRDP